MENGVAKVIKAAGIIIIGIAILGFIGIVSESGNFLIAFASGAGAGAFGIVLYAIGEIIELLQMILVYQAKLIDKKDNNILNNNSVNSVKSNNNSVAVRELYNSGYKFGSKLTQKNSEKGTCELCDKQDVDVIKCKIVDNLGTRYRKICPDCMKSNNATPTDY